MAITGNIHFYGKIGFLVAKSCGIWYAEDAEGKCFLIAELEAGVLKGMSGTYKDPTGCFVDEGADGLMPRSRPRKTEASRTMLLSKKMALSGNR